MKPKLLEYIDQIFQNDVQIRKFSIWKKIYIEFLVENFEKLNFFSSLAEPI